MNYKINEIREFEYEPEQKQFVVGSIVNFYEGNEIIAKCEILESCADKFQGKILVTYGNKRRK